MNGGMGQRAGRRQRLVSVVLALFAAIAVLRAAPPDLSSLGQPEIVVPGVELYRLSDPAGPCRLTRSIPSARLARSSSSHRASGPTPGHRAMVVRGGVVNHPSDATGPRKVSDAIVVRAR